MNTQKGFIQIPILLMFVASVVAVVTTGSIFNWEKIFQIPATDTNLSQDIIENIELKKAIIEPAESLKKEMEVLKKEPTPIASAQNPSIQPSIPDNLQIIEDTPKDVVIDGSPQITGIDPLVLPLQDEFTLTIQGENLKSGSEVSIGRYLFGKFVITDNGFLQKVVRITDPNIFSGKSINVIEVITPDGLYDSISVAVSVSKLPYLLSDKTPPNLSFDRLLSSWRDSDWINANCGMLYGSIGLNEDDLSYQDPQPSSGRSKIEYYVDGDLIIQKSWYLNSKGEVYSPTVIMTFNTETVSNGTHTLTAKVYDNAGNVGQASIEVKVLNPGISSLSQSKKDCPSY